MRVRAVLLLVGFVFQAGIHTGAAQVCSTDDDCAANGTCCRADGQCSVGLKQSATGGTTVDDACECTSETLLDATTCACSDPGHCPPGGGCNLDTSTCLTVCSTDGDCAADGTCCTAAGVCSDGLTQSATGGTTVGDACECSSLTLLDATTCACLSDLHCPPSETCDAAPGSATCLTGNECTTDDDCSDAGTCCRADGQCSEGLKQSATGGTIVDDACECTSETLLDATTCACSDPTHCPPGEGCNMDTSTCATACTGDDECSVGEVCCSETGTCVASGSTGACGDPHMTGFLGQTFDFTGEDNGWFALISDLPAMHLNMRVTAPVPSLPEITYITGLSLLATDADGISHSVIISVKEPHSLESACPTDVAPCLADGALNVVIDGEQTLVSPGTIAVAPDVYVSAVNIPGECRSFGFEKYWERKKLESAQAHRKLVETMDIGDWILGDPTATNIEECAEYVARAMTNRGGLFNHQSEHASFQIITPAATIRLSHGRLHQVAMRDPTDQFDLPDHLTWQMNLAIDRFEISHYSQGVLGETFVPTRDDDGNMIMHGIASIRGTEDGYAVGGPFGVAFAQGA